MLRGVVCQHESRSTFIVMTRPSSRWVSITCSTTSLKCTAPSPGGVTVLNSIVLPPPGPTRAMAGPGGVRSALLESLRSRPIHPGQRLRGFLMAAGPVTSPSIREGMPLRPRRRSTSEPICRGQRKARLCRALHRSGTHGKGSANQWSVSRLGQNPRHLGEPEAPQGRATHRAKVLVPAMKASGNRRQRQWQHKATAVP